MVTPLTKPHSKKCHLMRIGCLGTMLTDDSSDTKHTHNTILINCTLNVFTGSNPTALTHQITVHKYTTVNQLVHDKPKELVRDMNNCNHVFDRKLVDQINALSVVDIINHLLQEGLISKEQHQEIKKLTNTEYDQVALILGYVSKKDANAMVTFMNVLMETNHKHVVCIILDGLKEMCQTNDIERYMTIATDKMYSDLVTEIMQYHGAEKS